MDNIERIAKLQVLSDKFIKATIGFELDEEEICDIYSSILELLDDKYKNKIKIISLFKNEEFESYVTDSAQKQIVSIIQDQIIRLENRTQEKKDLEINKLLQAREEDKDFELKIAKMIDGDNEKFPKKTSYYISKFFQELGFNLTHDGTTKRYWIADRLKECNIEEIHTIITKGLFKKKYFINSDKDIDIAKEEFKNVIEECITVNEVLDLSGLFNLNLNNELLFNKEIKTDDDIFNDLINESKRLYLKGEKQLALEKIWDSFERIKTYYFTDKQKSIKQLCELLSQDLSFEIFDSEYGKLSKIGNHYQIRHFETDKIIIKSEEEKEYLFFRMLALINFSVNRINEVAKAK